MIVLTFREAHQAIDRIVGWKEAKDAVHNSGKGATKQSRDAFSNASAALLGVMLLETALDLGASFRVVQEGI